ncbi:hypothetical protein BH11PSE13_BH11PSE13_19460 [soil metagenome]
MTEKKKGLYANIHAKQERIEHGSGEHMRKAGAEGAPSGEDFEASAKTAKKPSTPRKTKTTKGIASAAAKSKRKS